MNSCFFECSNCWTRRMITATISPSAPTYKGSFLL